MNINTRPFQIKVTGFGIYTTIQINSNTISFMLEFTKEEKERGGAIKL